MEWQHLLLSLKHSIISHQFIVACICVVTTTIFYFIFFTKNKQTKGNGRVNRRKIAVTRKKCCKSCGKITGKNRHRCESQLVGDPDRDVDLIERESKIKNSASSVASSGASICSGCSEASLDEEGDMSKSQVRRWLNEKEPHGAMVDWMKQDAIRRGVALSDGRSQRSDTALSSKIINQVVYKGKRIKQRMRGIVNHTQAKKDYMVGYLLKCRRKRKGATWNFRRFFQSEQQESKPTTTTKRWQRRYFELPGIQNKNETNFRGVDSYVLRYFSDQNQFESNPGNPRGVIDLRQIESIRIELSTQTLHLVPKKELRGNKDVGVYAICAESKDSLNSWYKILDTRVKMMVSDGSCDSNDIVSISPSSSPSSSPTKMLLDEKKENKEEKAEDEEEEDTKNQETYDEENEIEKVIAKHLLKQKEIERLREILRILREDKTQPHDADTVLRLLRCDNNPYDTLPFICQRFLRGRKFNVKKALKTMHEDVTWRVEENIKELMHGGLDVREILGCNPAVVFNRHPVVVSGHDRGGRVVVYVCFLLVEDLFLSFSTHTHTHTQHNTTQIQIYG